MDPDQRPPGAWDWLLVLIRPDGSTELRRVTGIRRERDAVHACWPEAVPGAAVAVLDRAGMMRYRYVRSTLPAYAGRWTHARDTPGHLSRPNPPTTFGTTTKENP